MININMNRVTEILRMLVSTPSINPFENKGDGEIYLAEQVRRFFIEAGIDVREQEVVDGRYNIIGIIRGSRGGRRLILNGHMDTVDVKGMKVNPFSAEVDENGFLHGRGASDMKGGLAAMMAAAEALAGGNELVGELMVAAVVDEEYLGRGTQVLAKEFTATGAVVGEPTELKIGIAHKGATRYIVNIKGKAAHGSSPEKGIDAIAKACKFINEIYKIRFTKEHPILGKPVIHTSMINGGSEWSTVPGNCTVYVERRTIPSETADDVINEAREIMKDIKYWDNDFDGEVRLWRHFPPMEVSEKSDIVKILDDSVRVFGEPETVGLPYWTDAATMNLAGTPAVVFGPGSISYAHSDIEMINVHDVYRASLIYNDLAKNFLK
ncbi:MAG: ArgE/DapE family deacylase [Conexivisphaerales archaeon]